MDKALQLVYDYNELRDEYNKLKDEYNHLKEEHDRNKYEVWFYYHTYVEKEYGWKSLASESVSTTVYADDEMDARRKALDYLSKEYPDEKLHWRKTILVGNDVPMEDHLQVVKEFQEQYHWLQEDYNKLAESYNELLDKYDQLKEAY